jgi:hypothetical protein
MVLALIVHKVLDDFNLCNLRSGELMTPELRILGYFNPDQGRAWARKSVMLTMADESTLEQMVAKGLLRKSFFNEYARGEKAESKAGSYKLLDHRNPIGKPNNLETYTKELRAKNLQALLGFIQVNGPITYATLKTRGGASMLPGRLQDLIADGSIIKRNLGTRASNGHTIHHYATPEQWVQFDEGERKKE